MLIDTLPNSCFFSEIPCINEIYSLFFITIYKKKCLKHYLLPLLTLASTFDVKKTANFCSTYQFCKELIQSLVSL